MNYHFTSAAQADFRDAAHYYENQSKGLGDAFLDELQATVDRISMFPEAWGRVDNQFMHCHMRRFPYTVIYLLQDGVIVFVSVFHQSRMPESWRLKS